MTISLAAPLAFSLVTPFLTEPVWGVWEWGIGGKGMELATLHLDMQQLYGRRNLPRPRNSNCVLSEESGAGPSSVVPYRASGAPLSPPRSLPWVLFTETHPLPKPRAALHSIISGRGCHSENSRKEVGIIPGFSNKGEGGQNSKAQLLI